MCGINGVVRLGALEATPPIPAGETVRVRDVMAHRGPDGAGEWLSSDGRASFGHRRLAILDLSEAGAQPMASLSGRCHATFNGEIYNFHALRDELVRSGVRFRSRSDTEVLLELWEREGPAMLARLRGMFALAIWDERTAGGRLFLARDAFGIKPLYYAAPHGAAGTPSSGLLRFASQVKALEASGALSADLDPGGLGGFLLWGAVPEPFTLRRAIRALPAGHYLVADAASGRIDGPVDWLAGRPSPSGDASTTLTVPEAIEDSIRAHLVSDVPVGVFLSAGLDSSVIAAVARRAMSGSEPLRTVTLGFDVLRKTEIDEAPRARETAKELGARHFEQTVSGEDFAALWPATLAAMDQPSIDGFNTFLVSRAARAAGLKVVLSGLGGDEIFGSYPTFRSVPRTRRLASAIAALGPLARAWPALARHAWPASLKAPALAAHGSTLGGAYLLRRALFLPEDLPRLLGRDLARQALDAYDPRREIAAILETSLAARPGAGHGDAWLAVQALESSLYLKNQLLRDVDWASMAHSIEVRVPFVDLPLHDRLVRARFEPARTEGKARLLRSVAPELPAALFERRKTGFYIPVGEWAARAAAPMKARERGMASRTLARGVLLSFGIDLPV